MFYSMECTYFVENPLSTGFWRKFVSAFQSKTSILELALFSSVFETTSESRNILQKFSWGPLEWVQVWKTPWPGFTFPFSLWLIS